MTPNGVDFLHFLFFLFFLAAQLGSLNQVLIEPILCLPEQRCGKLSMLDLCSH